MFLKIELKNFQAHRNTCIQFDKGITSITGESDNGKTSIIRAIKWVVYNRPIGVDKLNSKWNENFKEPMSVKLFTEKGYVERIRSKDRNGYTICYNDKEPIELSAVKSDVPQEIKDFLKVTDVNFQFQLDQPYLLSMTPGEASKYLNNIIHLDSIDNILSVAESDKRSISSEQKVVDSDIEKLERRLKDTEWVDEAASIQKRIDKYNELIESRNPEIINLSSQVSGYQIINDKIVDMTEQKRLVEEIEAIQIPDTSELYDQIQSHRQASIRIVDMTEQKKLVEEIKSIDVSDESEIKKLSELIIQYNENVQKIDSLNNLIKQLKDELPDVCPTCGSIIDKEVCLCS